MVSIRDNQQYCLRERYIIHLFFLVVYLKNKFLTFQKVEPSNVSIASSGSDSRTDLLSEIRQGVKLQPAADRELGAQRDSTGSTGGTDALADALRRALQERGRALRSSDEDSDDCSDNNEEWDD